VNAPFPTLSREFPDYPLETLPLIPASWSDLSWHNDACPFFLITGAMGVFVDFADPTMRDYFIDGSNDIGGRFIVVQMDDGQHTEGASLLETDDWQAVLALAHSSERAGLASEYVRLIGYDPFADDPSLSNDDVAQTLAEHADEAARAESAQ
jgi:hypothetical protein